MQLQTYIRPLPLLASLTLAAIGATVALFWYASQARLEDHRSPAATTSPDAAERSFLATAWRGRAAKHRAGEQADDGGEPRLVPASIDLVPAPLRGKYRHVVRYAGPLPEEKLEGGRIDADRPEAADSPATGRDLSMAEQRARLKEMMPELRAELEQEEKDWPETLARVQRLESERAEAAERTGLADDERALLEHGGD